MSTVIPPANNTPVYRNPARAALRRDANCIGLGLLFLFGLMLILYDAVCLLLVGFGVVEADAVLSDPFLGLGNTGYLLVYGAVYTLMMGLPMFLAALIFRERAVPLRPHGPVSLWRGLLWLLCGLGLCLVANFITNFIMAFLVQFGVPVPEMPDLLINTPLSLVLNIVVFAVLPALLEEIFFRGYVLQLLRRYNDTAALFVSALLFGLMHGNVLQIPFAFMVGLILGLIVLRTDNIWLAVGLHFLNNAMSMALQYIGLFADTEAERALQYYTLAAILILIGAVAGVVLLATRRKKAPKVLSHTWLPAGQVFTGSLFKAPLLLISVILFAVITVLSVLTPYIMAWLEGLS